ncbi:MAG: hypothetical protein ACREDD_03040 [Methylocella sp.]
MPIMRRVFAWSLGHAGASSTLAARFHIGPANNPAQKQYVCQAIANRVAVDFGAWNANARAFRIEQEP